ncbi:DsrE family protein [Cognatishimia sp. F0-27]|uniref:DsrE family protein n=1 Tax=Cognatishimia sp. F0-27 TaxID=2816855 RepID=UPI001D0C204F|nr:DsrE family protein [Cognatishimia sp. F0-27]MCC1491752.1 DsrE family protein [Cognatishimia sp. F0-27]
MLKSSLTAAALSVAFASAVLAEGVTHHVAVHVNDGDPKVMNMALNNVQNLTRYYESQGDSVVVELVAYGPGLNMLLDGRSPVADRISVMSLEMDNLSFAACGNTHRKMSEKAGETLALLDDLAIVPSGVVRLIELQEEGYAYIRP